jgi:serine/threonine protein phosphatase PrpC
MVDDAGIRHIIKDYSEITERVQHLIEAANRGGGKDNISVAMIEI